MTRKNMLALAASTVLLAASPSSADIDLTGRWQYLGTRYAQIVQTGSDVTVTMTEDIGGTETPLTLTGTFDQTTLSATDGTYYLTMIPYGSGAVLDGSLRASFAPLGGANRRFSRCECYDGDFVDGDGCDAGCQVEPCFECTPEPSVCSASSDGAACDDRNDCTAGESCTSGTCGGGSAVSPCVNMTGMWRVDEETTSYIDAGLSRRSFTSEFLQRDGVVTASDLGIGTIDASTGMTTLVARPGGLFCSYSRDVDLTAAGDGQTYSGTGSSYWTGPRFCFADALTQQASRCHETLGCELTDCTGLPDGTPCSDGDPCTWSDFCTAGSCSGPPKCPTCEACVGSGYCDEAPRTDCTQSTGDSAVRMQILNAAGPAEDFRLKWKWKKGPALSTEAFGRPHVGDDITLCVFNSDQTLIWKTSLTGGAACEEPPCWDVSTKGLRYKPDGALPSAFTSISLRSGEERRSSVQIDARGEKLVDAWLGFPFTPAPVPLYTQLQIDNGACFQGNFEADGVSVNESGDFKAKGQ